MKHAEFFGKGVMRRILAFVLCACMLMSGMNLSTVYAEEDVEDVIESSEGSGSESEEVEEIIDSTEGNEPEDVPMAVDDDDDEPAPIADVTYDYKASGTTITETGSDGHTATATINNWNSDGNFDYGDMEKITVTVNSGSTWMGEQPKFVYSYSDGAECTGNETGSTHDKKQVTIGNKSYARIGFKASVMVGTDTVGTYTAHVSPVTNSITDPDTVDNLTYNGEEQALLKSAAVAAYDSEKILYRVDNGDWVSDYTKVLATTAGNHTVEYTVPSSIYYTNSGEITGSVTVNIAKASVTNTASTSFSTTYNGSATYADASISLSGGNLADYTVSYADLTNDTVQADYEASIPEFTNAGTYTVGYKVAINNNKTSNYTQLEYTGTFTVTIDPKDPTTNDFVVTIPKNKKYGSDEAPSVRVRSGITGMGEPSLVYYKGSVKLSSAPTAAGTYTVKINVTNDADHTYNYNGVTDLGDYTYVINKAEATITQAPVVASGEETYSEEGYRLITTAGSASGGHYEYCYSYSNTSEESDSFSDYAKTMDVTVYNVGIYKIKYKFVPDDNHTTTEVEQDVILTIIPATASVTQTPQGINRTYSADMKETDDSSKLVTAGTYSNGTMKFKLSGDTEYSDEIPRALDAGTYTVEWKFEPDANYTTSSTATTSGSIEVEIYKAAGNVTAPTAKTLTYSGSNQDLIEAGSSTTGTIKYRLGADGSWETEIPQETNAGDYTVYYRVDSTNNNYNDVAEQSIDVTIAQKEVSPTIKVTKVSGLKYNNEAHDLVTGEITDDSELGQLEYSTTGKDGSYSTTIPQKNDAGTYTVYYRYVLKDAENYKVADKIESTGTVTDIVIEQVDGSITAPDANSQTYTGKDIQLVKNNAKATGKIWYSLDSKKWQETIPTAKNVGTYYVYYKADASKNYKPVDVCADPVAVKISKADPAAADFTFTAPTSTTYNGSAKEAAVAAASGITGMGGITVKYFDSQGKQLESAPTAVGTYTVKIDVADGDNYNAVTNLTDDTWKFTIRSVSYSGGYVNNGSNVSNGTNDKDDSSGKDEDSKDDSEDISEVETPTVTSPVVVGATEKLKSAVAVTSAKTTQTLSWNEITGADGYKIYGAKCGSEYKLLKTVKAGSDLSFKNTKLAAGTYYKYYVVAYQVIDGKKVTINKSIASHVVTAGSSKANAEKVKVNSTNISVSVASKKTIKAKAVYSNGKTATSGHSSTIRYKTSNSKIATVSSKGVVTAKKKGTCYVYCYAMNGIYKRVKITVK